VQEVVHFTHFTVAHAHFAMYAFVTMVLFGSVYYIMPRSAKWEWPYPTLIKTHFWLSAIGVVIYVVSMTVGGWLQGLTINNPIHAFIEAVNITKPYLWARSVGGVMMTLGNLLFAYHFALVVYRAGPRRFAPAWLQEVVEAHSE
jgi:cytochrome c oxidase cbb3-type subunit 1